MDDCNLEKTPILEDLGRYIEAGELRAAAGDTVDAIRLFILGGDQDLAAQCLCDAFWEQMPFGMTMTDLNAERVRALKEVSAEINATTPQLKNEVRTLFSYLAVSVIHDWSSLAQYVPCTAGRRRSCARNTI